MLLNLKAARKRAIKVAIRHGWSDEFKRIDTLPNGSWVFWNVDPVPWEDARQAVVVRQDNGFASALYGAIGKAYFLPGQPLALGRPKSTERWIGSGPGRYQLFDKGIIVWDAVTR
jgi:hypothetical protein